MMRETERGTVRVVANGDPVSRVRSGRLFPSDIAEIVADHAKTDVVITPVNTDGDVIVKFGDQQVYEVFDNAMDAGYRAKTMLQQKTRSKDVIRQGVITEVRHSMGMGAVRPNGGRTR